MNIVGIQRDSAQASKESEVSVPDLRQISPDRLPEAGKANSTARGVAPAGPPGSIAAIVFALAVLCGAMYWAKSSDPFDRIWFNIKTPSYGRVKGAAILPGQVRPFPVVICLHDSGRRLMTEGNTLRQFAELGMAAVGLEYDPTNQAQFDEQFLSLNNYIKSQAWARTDAIAWIGFGIGAQRTLTFILNHPGTQPQLLVRCSAGRIEELDDKTKGQALTNEDSAFMLHGEANKVFPAEGVWRVKELLETNGISNVLKILPGKGREFGTDYALVMRLLGEYCKARLTPSEPLPAFPEANPLPLLVCMLPALAWGLLGYYWNRGSKRVGQGKTTHGRLEIQEGIDSRALSAHGREQAAPALSEKALRWAAAGLAALAIADAVVHLILANLAVSQGTLGVARIWLVPTKWRDDFEMLASQRIWRGQQLKTLLEHAELANYTVNELVNWKVDGEIYRKYVLSPVIDSRPEHELKWRRLLWESFYPRVRHERTPEAAAEILLRYMRERVTVAPGFQTTSGIESVWKRHITNEKGFQEICVAALRSVGVGARLNTSGQAEFWTGEHWSSLPHLIPISPIQ